MINSKGWIKTLDLEPHTEGGYFREIYRSEGSIPGDALKSIGLEGKRAFSTGIYYLLEGDQFSAFHKLKTDETWHFYYGCTLMLYIISPDGKLEQVKLGSNIFNGEVFQTVIPAGSWFGAYPNNQYSFSLVGCTVSPGFEYSDFELANRKELLNLYPQHKHIITRLTNDD